MAISEKVKILILVVLVGFAVYFITQSSKSDSNNSYYGLERFESSGQNDMTISDMAEMVDTSSMNSQLPTQTDNNNNRQYQDKLKSKNSANGNFKSSNYKSGDRNSASSSLDSFFEGNHPEDTRNNNNYTAFVDNEARYAAYSPGKDQKLSEKDKFDPKSLLPSEKNADWFDDPYESTSVKASHLINIFRPVGVNTIQTTLKNASHDLRGTEPNPKYPVSPWQNSSYEPDTNLRSKAFC
jgi:hypothetical protein